MKIKLLCLFLLIGAIFLNYRLYLYETEETFRQGVSELKEGKFKSSLNKLTPYAIKGNLVAKKLVGQFYAFGWGVPINENEAEKWFSCKGINNCVPEKANTLQA
ncbi:MAG: hypothetical protein NTV43_09160 [Methylococcales bacterium]|nr:hypothetical protein [Methylococcales bacterium]